MLQPFRFGTTLYSAKPIRISISTEKRSREGTVPIPAPLEWPQSQFEGLHGSNAETKLGYSPAFDLCRGRVGEHGQTLGQSGGRRKQDLRFLAFEPEP